MIKSANLIDPRFSDPEMRRIDGGRFFMGSGGFYPEEAPVREVRVNSFLIDVRPVTNADFTCFVDATGYVTFSEIAPDPADYPGMLPEFAQPGSLVFARTDGPVDLDNPANWWSFMPGADWCHPWGPNSSIAGLEDHPVVHVAYADALAYASWAGKSLPTEAEWEYAARGGLDRADFAWGDELTSEGVMLANYWQGNFPYANQLLDGYEGTSPVGSYPANAYGLYDMIGNVWEWTQDWWASPSAHRKPFKGAHCIPLNPRGGKEGGRPEESALNGADHRGRGCHHRLPPPYAAAPG